MRVLRLAEVENVVLDVVEAFVGNILLAFNAGELDADFAVLGHGCLTLRMDNSPRNRYGLAVETGFYLGLALKVALVTAYVAWKQQRSVTLLERSDRARNGKIWGSSVESVPAKDKGTRTVEGEVL